jgi:hypothetical protein
MTRFVPVAALTSLVLLSACQAATTTQTPRPNASAQATVQPSASSNPDAAQKTVLEAESYAAIAGLDRQADGALTSPVADLTLRAGAGSIGAEVVAADVTYVVGATRVGPLRVKVAPTRVPAGGPGATGLPVTVSVPLPTGDVREALSADVSLRAEVAFVDDQGYQVLGLDLQPLRVALPLSLSATATPAARLMPAAAPAVAPSAPPASLDTGGKPKVADLAGFSPAALRLKAGALDPTAAQVRLYAWAGSDGTQIVAYSVTYRYATPGEADAQPAGTPVRKPLRAPFIVPAASSTAHGAPAELTLTLDPAALRSQLGMLRPGLVNAHVQFEDAYGFAVLNRHFQPLELRLPILAD